MSEVHGQDIPLSRWIHTEVAKNMETTNNEPSRPSSSSLSRRSKLFMLLATFQAIVTLGLQVSMAFIGYQIHNGTHADYCLSSPEQTLLDCVDSFGSMNRSESNLFGDDKFIYIIFFIGLTVYNLVLCIYSLKQQDRVEVFAFVITNTLTLLYAGLQVYQFRGYGGGCGALTVIGWIAVANMSVLSLFAPVFWILSALTYFEFGWKIYKHVNLMSSVRSYFHWYELFISGVKLVLLFTITFCIAEVVLLLPPHDPEFGLTIVMLVAAIVVCVLIHTLVQMEYLWAYICIALLSALLIAYYMFKVGRFASHSCPLCHILDSRNKLNQTLIEICQHQTNLTNVTIPVARLDEITNLLIISLLNLVTTTIVFAVFIKVWCSRGKGLKEHFAEYPTGPLRIIKKLKNYCTRRNVDLQYTERSPLVQNK